MQYLIDWITQIIIFLLLAAVVDLLIPKNALKKYVQFVIGFILILIFLKPVFFIFNFNAATDLKTAFETELEQLEDDTNTDFLIEKQKKDIESVQNAYILEQMAVQLKGIAQEPLANEFQAEIKAIDYEFSVDNELTYENLERLLVYVGKSGHGEGMIHEIEQVQIQANETTEHQDNPAVVQMEQLLLDVWEIEDKEVTVIWEGGTS
ncbi:stage III sporulation protein AF [Ornithinibacillus gellani]|uniref:stage III sporulation protein AF n=1 Tax=Ornithinibacillus gellani TaxID=2293253 RepID=UPI000F478CF0|nr:stage III sporulation protein AF [Ornithinibacillus gellani]TQS74516.1 stage III sporulation protein AF [Ornithinibacillus gellani]